MCGSSRVCAEVVEYGERSPVVNTTLRRRSVAMEVLAHLVLTHLVAQQEIDPGGGKGAQEHGESSHLRYAVREQEGM